MSSEIVSDNRKVALIHIHTCIHCGQARYREDIGDHEINSGILHCPGCGMDGPLNVQIQKSSTE
jgi:transcription elongation factor Elf1